MTHCRCDVFKPLILRMILFYCFALVLDHLDAATKTGHIDDDGGSQFKLDSLESNAEHLRVIIRIDIYTAILMSIDSINNILHRNESSVAVFIITVIF